MSNRPSSQPQPQPQPPLFSQPQPFQPPLEPHRRMRMMMIQSQPELQELQNIMRYPFSAPEEFAVAGARAVGPARPVRAIL